jgi:hypothetical protein
MKVMSFTKSTDFKLLPCDVHSKIVKSKSLKTYKTHEERYKIILVFENITLQANHNN